MDRTDKLVSAASIDFVRSLPTKVKDRHFATILCFLFDGFGLSHEARAQICEDVLNVMLEAEMRSDESAAQAADDVIARATAKARK